jgi:cytochrome d ubiquinol oxidase subunit I
MVVIGMLLLALSFVYLVAKWRSWAVIERKWFNWLLVAGGPLAIIAIETGWWLAEVGRQPWILRGIMLTEEGATTSSGVDSMSVLFSLLYIVLGIGSVVTLHRMFRNNPIEREIQERTEARGEDLQ